MVCIFSGTPDGQVDAGHGGTRFPGCGRYSQRVTDTRKVGRGRGLGRESPLGVGARRFCAWLLRPERRDGIQYKCTGIYNSKAESAIRWNDPAIGIEWPLADVVVSEKDRNARTFEEWLASPESDHFRYSEQPELEFSLGS